MSTAGQLMILCPMVFLAGLVDAAAGGGGLISLPAYLLAGIPVHMAIGTNKLSATCSTLVATVRFAAGRKIHGLCAGSAVVSALLMSYLGAQAVLFVDDFAARVVLLAALPPVAILVLVRKRLSDEDKFERRSVKRLVLSSLCLGAAVGFYDGFIGPGTGTFLTLGFSALGFSAVRSAGNAKAVNLASGCAALAVFWRGDQVLWGIGFLAAVFAMAGGWLGAHLTVRFGAKLIRPLFISIVLLLLGNMLYELVFP